MTYDENPTKNFHEALFAAQKSARNIIPDSENTSQNYAYLSGPGSVSRCRAILHEHGLMPMVHTVTNTNTEGDKSSGMVTLHWDLVHVESGQSLNGEFTLPWLSQRGTTPPKAAQASITSAEGRWLRVLLALPVKGDDEIDNLLDSGSATKAEPQEEEPVSVEGALIRLAADLGASLDTIASWGTRRESGSTSAVYTWDNLEAQNDLMPAALDAIRKDIAKAHDRKVSLKDFGKKITKWADDQIPY